jgi:hypothetical protein
VAAAGPWRLGWRRFRRDRWSLGAALALAVLALASFAGRPIAVHLLHHGPTDPFPYDDAVIGRLTELVMAFPLIFFLVMISVRVSSYLNPIGFGGAIPAGVPAVGS